MTAYDVVFSKQASMRYMQKDAGIGSIIKGIAKGIQRARNQRAIAKEWRKAQKFKARSADFVSQSNAARAASDATLNAAVAKSGWSNLAGNIKGSRQAAKADDLQVLAKDAEKAFTRRQMAIEKLLVAQGATKEQARAITRNVNAQKYLQYGDADGAMKLQAIRDRRLQAVAQGRAQQQAAQQAAQTTNNTLNGGGGFQVTFSNAPGTIMPVQQTAQTVQPAVQVIQPSAQAAAQSAAKATKPAAKAAKPATQAAAAQAAVQAAAKAVASNRARQRAAQAAAQSAGKATKPAAKAAKPVAQPAAQATQPAAQAANNALNRVGGFAVTLHQ